METLKTAVSEQEIQENTDLQQIETKEQVKLLTMGRDRTKEERLKYLEFRKKEQNNLKRKGKRIHGNYKQNTYKVQAKPKKSSGRVKLGDGKTTNTEHLNPRSRGGSNNIKNLKKSNINYHDHKHGYFGNKLLHEQLKQVVGDNYDVMYEETRDIIVKAIDHIITYFVKKKKFYNPKTFKNEHFIPKA